MRRPVFAPNKKTKTTNSDASLLRQAISTRDVEHRIPLERDGVRDVNRHMNMLVTERRAIARDNLQDARQLLHWSRSGMKI